MRVIMHSYTVLIPYYKHVGISYYKTACVHTGNTFSINLIMHSYIVLIPFYNGVGISYYKTACVHRQHILY